MIDVMAFEGEPILEFKDEYRWLSNFHDYIIVLGGRMFASAEHAFNATKTLDPEEQKLVERARSPFEAKKIGRTVTLRPNWDEVVRYQMMRLVVEAKFPEGDGALTKKLLETGKRLLVEGNDWGDRTWGATWEPLTTTHHETKWAVRTFDDKPSEYLVGDNWLGRLLMERRDALRGGGA